MSERVETFEHLCKVSAALGIAQSAVEPEVQALIDAAKTKLAAAKKLANKMADQSKEGLQ